MYGKFYNPSSFIFSALKEFNHNRRDEIVSEGIEICLDSHKNLSPANFINRNELLVEKSINFRYFSFCRGEVVACFVAGSRL
jgi:hypothetical protein